MLRECPTLFSYKQWVNVCYQLLLELHKIHRMHVLINDVKWDNILVDVSGTDPSHCVRYIDFGLASFRKGCMYGADPAYMQQFIYLAPEPKNGHYTSPASDLYSLGYVIDAIYDLAGVICLDPIAAMCMNPDPRERPRTMEMVERVREMYDSLD